LRAVRALRRAGATLRGRACPPRGPFARARLERARLADRRRPEATRAPCRGRLLLLPRRAPARGGRLLRRLSRAAPRRLLPRARPLLGPRLRRDTLRRVP